MELSHTAIFDQMHRYTVGSMEPDFILASGKTFQRLFDFISDAHLSDPRVAVRCYTEKFERRGLAYNGAILLLDRNVPEGIVRFENHVDPDNPHLNGDWIVGEI